MPSITCCSRSLLLVAVALGATTTALPAQRYVGIAAGVADIREYNQLASPLIYAGTAASLSLGYYSDAQHGSWAVQAEVLFANLTPAEADAVGSRASAEHVRLRFPVLRQVVGSAHGANVRLGGSLVSDLFYRDHAYRRGVADEPYADGFTGLDALVQGNLRLGATRVALELAAPAMRIAWRTPYSGLKYVPAAQLALPDRYHGIDGALLLQHPVSARWSFTAALRMSSLSDSGEWSLEHESRQVSLGLRRQLGGTAVVRPAVAEGAR